MTHTLQTALIADDHEIVCDGIEQLLKTRWPKIQVYKAMDGVAARDLAIKEQPQLLILDLSMPKMFGSDVAREIRRSCPKAHIIILTAFSNEQNIREAARANADAIVLKDDGNQQLLDAIEKVLNGARYYSKKLHPLLASLQNEQEGDQSTKKRSDTLTPRERQILKLVAEGYSSKEIARFLELSPRTVDNHRRHLMLKLNAKNALELSAYAHSAGII
ncbi:response regulator transcription factor [Magnetococcus sp. PR-3]|uniref:response regulator transcription factor n=1 Tax=Magnetococcus sp. PR-3 TaxID=3120355 RepID=UPI002FCDFF77